MEDSLSEVIACITRFEDALSANQEKALAGKYIPARDIRNSLLALIKAAKVARVEVLNNYKKHNDSKKSN